MEEDSVYAYNDEYGEMTEKEKKWAKQIADGFVKFLEDKEKRVSSEKRENK